MQPDSLPSKRERAFRAFVSCTVPKGMHVDDACEHALNQAVKFFPGYGPVAAADIDEGRRWVELCFSFSMRDPLEAAGYAADEAARALLDFNPDRVRVLIEEIDPKELADAA